MQLAVFDLDHTLLSGDSDRLWCDFLVDLGWLDADWRERCVRIADGCAAGTIAPQAYCDFHASTLAGREPAALLPLRQRFLAERVRPRIPDDARALLRRHADEGHRVVLTTATSRVVSEFTARELGIDDHLATEVEVIDGRYTGHAVAPPNMRMGKVDRLRRWLAEQGAPETALQQAFFYFLFGLDQRPAAAQRGAPPGRRRPRPPARVDRAAQGLVGVAAASLKPRSTMRRKDLPCTPSTGPSGPA